MVTCFILLREFHFLLYHNLSCHCLVEQNQPIFWETKGKEHPLFKECCSSKREAQSSAFPSYFLSELPLGRLPAFLPCCDSQSSTDLAEPTLAFGSCFSTQAECRAPAQSSGRATASGRDWDFQVCPISWSSPEQAHSELTPPSGSVLGWRRVNDTRPPELDL